MKKVPKDELEINLPWQMFRSLFCFFQSINNVSILLRLSKLEKTEKKKKKKKKKKKTTGRKITTATIIHLPSEIESYLAKFPVLAER